MNEQTNSQQKPPAQGQGHGGGDRSGGYGEAPRFTVDKANGKVAGKKNAAVLGPFTVRDLTVFGSTLVLFVASLIPMFADRYNLWNLGSLFFLGLGILLPVTVAALFAARRLSPESKIRIGSLSVDQFGSVVASFAVAFFFLAVAGDYVPTMLLALVGALGLFVATVLGRLLPVLAGDFLGRAEVPAHVVARESAVPFRKPRAPKEPMAPGQATDETTPKASGAGAVAGWAKRMTSGGQSAAPEPAAAPAPVQEAPVQSAMNAPHAGSPATQVAAVVAAAPSATAQTQAAGAVPPAATSAAGAQAPEAQAADAQTSAQTSAPASAPAAAEETRPAEVPAASSASMPTTVNPQVRQAEPIGATVDPDSRPEAYGDQPVHEAFWFAVAQPRTAVDEHSGAAAFVIEPGGWVLALEDRGDEFLVQHTDGRVGLLRDLSNIERG
ncbi:MULTISPECIES: hypothetical protein [unclassified Arthrobacter]|uniref:hypothetical protein n=1 Tax=unclassified Arthrobacter TaxID=235627 RepID=UPI001CFF7278|nr:MULTISPECIES: hypothetical protein [unclassified Arthrobacter]MCB5282894.1 hypothetical protein [Arthrobacter sp. ES1]WGZ78927.1 hypothetical protein QI450_13850 [Arthrobacter sp. EM1]